MRITIQDVARAEKNPKGWSKRVVTYEVDGKEKQQTLVDFGPGKDVYTLISQAIPGDIFDIKLQKNGEYYNWVSATKVVGEEGVVKEYKETLPKTRSTYETPEERAARQVFIIRQSSVSSAIAYLAKSPNFESFDKVLRIAQQIEKFVMAKGDEGVVQETEAAPTPKKRVVSKATPPDHDPIADDWPQ